MKKGGTFLLLGQTDAGKSTFAGHLLFQCGFFDEEKLELNEAGNKFSKLIDSTNGELLHNKSRTTDYISRDFAYNNVSYTLIDTPGHKIYIRSLIEGLYSVNIDLIVLVISSIKDEYYTSITKGTVREDLLLARSVGCGRLLVAWNKHDIASINDTDKEELKSYIKLLRFTQVDHINISALKGENILDVLSYIPEPKPEQRLESKKTNTNTFQAVIAFHTTEIISAGFAMVIHHESGEIEAEIEGLYKNGKIVVYVKDREPYTVNLKCSKPVNIAKGDRIVLRSFTETIGFGKIS